MLIWIKLKHKQVTLNYNEYKKIKIKSEKTVTGGNAFWNKEIIFTAGKVQLLQKLVESLIDCFNQKGAF